MAVTSHGTILRRQAGGTGLFVPVASVGDMTLPGLSRNEFDATSHDEDIDQYALGVLRREPPTFPLFFDRNQASHNHLTGLYDAIIDNQLDGWSITQPDGFKWIFSGFVRNITPTAPVDGIQTATVTIRPTGTMLLGISGGAMRVIGASALPQSEA